MQLYPNQPFTWFMQVIWVNPNPIHLNAGSVFLTWTNLYLLHIIRYGSGHQVGRILPPYSDRVLPKHQSSFV